MWSSMAYCLTLGPVVTSLASATGSGGRTQAEQTLRPRGTQVFRDSRNREGESAPGIIHEIAGIESALVGVPRPRCLLVPLAEPCGAASDRNTVGCGPSSNHQLARGCVAVRSVDANAAGSVVHPQLLPDRHLCRCVSDRDIAAVFHLGYPKKARPYPVST